MSDIKTINVNDEIEIWKLMMSQSDHLIKSGALPKAFTNSNQVLAVIQYGRELDLKPMTALQNISLINGKPTLSANLIGARLKNAGYKFKLKKYEEDEVIITFTNLDGIEQNISYTMKEASKAGNASKDNYKKYDKEMLYARCLSRGGRIVAPEVLAGVYALEEFEIELPKSEKIEDKKISLDETVEGELAKSIEQPKPIDIKILIEKVKKATTKDGLKFLWDTNIDLRLNEEFKNAVKDKNIELAQAQIPVVPVEPESPSKIKTNEILIAKGLKPLI